MSTLPRRVSSILPSTASCIEQYWGTMRFTRRNLQMPLLLAVHIDANIASSMDSKFNLFKLYSSSRWRLEPRKWRRSRLAPRAMNTWKLMLQLQVQTERKCRWSHAFGGEAVSPLLIEGCSIWASHLQRNLSKPPAKEYKVYKMYCVELNERGTVWF